MAQNTHTHTHHGATATTTNDIERTDILSIIYRPAVSQAPCSSGCGASARMRGREGKVAAAVPVGPAACNICCKSDVV